MTFVNNEFCRTKLLPLVVYYYIQRFFSLLSVAAALDLIILVFF